MHLEVPNKLLDDMQVDEEQLEPRQIAPMAWFPRKLGGNKRPSTKLENFANKIEGGDEFQKLTPIVKRTSLEVTTHT